MKNVLFLFLLISILISISSCDGVQKRRDLKKDSIYLGKEVTSSIPLVYLKNLPHVNDVSKYVANNSPVLVAIEANFELAEFENHCINCLSPDRLVTPIRVEYIPVGSEFKVVDNYLSFRHTPIGPSKIPVLILKDKSERISEISELSFELNFVNSRNSKRFVSTSETETLNILKIFEKGDGPVAISYCPQKNISPNQNVSKFIHDFRLEDDVKIFESQPYCEDGTTITFLSAESLLTARYYFEEWSLYGDWHLIQ